MNREEELCSIETPPYVIAPAIVFGVGGALYLGYQALSVSGVGGRGMSLGVMDFIIVVLTGASVGAGLVGLFWLLCGAHLGRSFSCVFTICLSCVSAGLVGISLIAYGSQVDGKLITDATFAWTLVVGVGGGVFLTKKALGYSRRSRIWAAVALALMLVIGWFLVPEHMERIGVLGVMIGLGAFGLLGGVTGAVGGAICDLLVRPRRAPLRQGCVGQARK